MNTHTAAEVVAELIRLEDMGTSPKRNKGKAPWPTITGPKELDSDDAIFVTTTAMPTNGRIQKTGETQGLESFQVRVRHEDFTLAQAKVKEIADKFDSIRPPYELTLEGKLYRVQGIHRKTQPVHMGEDSNRRENFSINYIASVHEV